jgi:nucleotide-binding universal stress UspA family protein
VLAPTAVHLLDEPATVHLVHVRNAADSLGKGGAGADETRALGWAPRFARLEQELDRRELAAVQRSVLRGGDAATRLIRYVNAHAADLIVVGTGTTKSLKTRLFGGVGRRILRTVDRPVLLVGPFAGPRPHAMPAASERDVNAEPRNTEKK